MKMMNYLILILFLFSYSCKEQITQPSDEQSAGNTNGSLKLALDMSDAPEEVVRLDGLLYRGRSEQISFDFKIEGNSATAVVDEIPSGEWTLRVYAYDVDDNVVYSGLKQISITSGVVTPVSIHLNSTTGSLEITVTWGNNQTTTLAAFYPFNGNANDEGGNGNHGIVMGAKLTSDRFGNANSAYLFDGLDDEIIVENYSSLDIEGAITVCAWFKTDVSQWGALVCNFDQLGPDHGYEFCVGSLYEDGGFIYFECAKDDIRDGLSTNESFNDGQWHFAVGVLAPDGTSRRRIFVDAIEKFGYDNPLGGPINGIGTTPNYPFKIGATSNQEGPEASSNFKGAIDDVRIYDGALSEAEIKMLYEEGR